MKNVNKWFLVTIAALGLLLLIAGKNFIIAQTSQLASQAQVKCQTFTGLLSSWPTVTRDDGVYDSDRAYDPSQNNAVIVIGQSRNVYEYAAIDAPGLGPQNIISIFELFDTSHCISGSYGGVEAIFGGEGTEIPSFIFSDGKIYGDRNVTYWSRNRPPIYDEYGTVTGYGDWSAWTSEEYVYPDAYKFNVLYAENLAVENPGSGKALNLDWQNVAPGGGVAGYRIYRRELPAQ